MIKNDVAYNARALIKKFPGVLAINNIDITVKKGEIHGVIGKNGAGKTVLMSIIAGILKPNQGSLFVNAKNIDLQNYSPGIAIKEGIALIPQEPMILRHMSVMDNMFLNSEIKNKLGLLNRRLIKKKTKEIIANLNLNVEPEAIMGEILLEDQQLLTLGKALFINQARIILLDEITASLPKEQKTKLLNLLKNLIKEDPELSFTLISHHIHEIMDFCDRVTVLRDGEVINTLDVSKTNSKQLSDFIVGDMKLAVANENKDQNKKRKTDEEKPILELHNLSLEDKYQSISFNLQQGQIIGLAGLDGSGKYEFLETLAGIQRADSGEVFLEGKSTSLINPIKTLQSGLTYLPKKREEHAIIHNRSVHDNILLSTFNKFTRYIDFVDYAATRRFAKESIKKFKIKTPTIHENVDNLSGGNRQKVVLSRVFSTNSKVYILNEPTRGVDISAKPEIMAAIRFEFSRKGGVIFTSESEEELVDICDKILVFFKGQIIRVFDRGDEDFSFQEVYKASQGVL